jgi:hypothetical protein
MIQPAQVSSLFPGRENKKTWSCNQVFCEHKKRKHTTNRHKSTMQVCAFDVSTVPLGEKSAFEDISSKKWIEVQSGCKLYDLLVRHIAEYSNGASSFNAEVTKGPSLKKGSVGCCENPAKTPTAKSIGRIQLSIGLGVFTFTDFDGNRLYAIHQTKGQPVGTQCGVEVYKSLVVVTDGTELSLAQFFSRLVEMSEVTQKGIITIYTFHSRHHYWRQSSETKARPLSSVILPEQSKAQVMGDLANFMSEDMREFYEAHGIPYRRYVSLGFIIIEPLLISTSLIGVLSL